MQQQSRTQTKSGPGRIPSRPQERRDDKQFAADNGIPEPLRRYARRFGMDVFSLAQLRTQADALIASGKPA